MTNNMHAGPSCEEVLAKAFLEIVGLLILITPMAYIYVFASNFEPFHRGFFCDDQNLKHPYLPQTVPIIQCVLIWAAVSTFFIVTVETLRSWAQAQEGTRRNKPFPNNRTPWIAVELYRHFGYFTLGALITLLFTELSKYTIGRLRPHFLTLCRPKLTSELCDDEFGYKRFVIEDEEEICEGLISGEVTKKQLHEARLSFLSGHASFSFYCGMFLIVYLQARLTNFPRPLSTPVRIIYRTFKVLRPFIQFAMIILSFWISLTRISNYFHHPMDVLTGACVGMSFAIITLMVIADVFNKRSSFWRTMVSQKSTESQENASFQNPRSHTSSVTVPISPYNNEILNMNNREPFAMIDNSATMEEQHTLKTKM
eukprot:GFUD01009413.1.p1 GENE.GFUD01009413.1~~GFUD01009413.1.p1  ORF type:complete len:369 (-),score=54.02 GFUD01009413.1:923-2029(-)